MKIKKKKLKPAVQTHLKMEIATANLLKDGCCNW